MCLGIDGGGSRREAETAAVARLARIVAGDRAAVGHSDDGAPYLTGYDGYISVSHSRLMAILWLSTARCASVLMPNCREGSS